MKTIKVVAAVIKEVNDNGEPIIFATQRGYGEFKDGWEFPGGKIEAGDTTGSIKTRNYGRIRYKS
jgi:8-oxo-dGTP diphosphatase